MLIKTYFIIHLSRPRAMIIKNCPRKGKRKAASYPF